MLVHGHRRRWVQRYPHQAVFRLQLVGKSSPSIWKIPHSLQSDRHTKVLVVIVENTSSDFGFGS